MVNSRDTYKRFAQFYDTYVGDFRADLPFYLSQCEKGRRILEIGCGTGRVLRAFLEKGYQITGADISPEMLSIAAQKLSEHLMGGTLTLLDHDFRFSPLNQQFDRVLVTFYTFNYLLEDKEQSDFLRNVSASMASKALIMLDLFYPASKSKPEIDGQWQESTYETKKGRAILRQRRIMLGDVEERIQVYIEGESREEILTHRKHIPKENLAALLTEAGFANVRVAHGYSTPDLHRLERGEATTSSFLMIAEKP